MSERDDTRVLTVLFRVWRSVAPAVEGGPEESPHVIWEGTDPSQYRGGIGSFDEGDCHPCRWMEMSVDGGMTWLPYPATLMVTEEKRHHDGDDRPYRDGSCPTCGYGGGESPCPGCGSVEF